MEARGFMEPVNEFNHWWWNHKVAELDTQKTKSIKIGTNCNDALTFLKSNGMDRAPVEDNEE